MATMLAAVGGVMRWVGRGVVQGPGVQVGQDQVLIRLRMKPVSVRGHRNRLQGHQNRQNDRDPGLGHEINDSTVLRPGKAKRLS